MRNPVSSDETKKRSLGAPLADSRERRAPRASAKTKPAARAVTVAKAKPPSPERARSRSRRAPKEEPAVARSPKRPLPVEEILKRAIDAKTPRARLLWARRGIASGGRRPDTTLRSLLLRQLYLAFYETRRFDEALAVARQNLELDVLPDVVHQDAARAAQALGQIETAASHLRLAARSGPVRRRAFHWWTLGSLYFLAGRHADAVTALTRAARWGTTDKPLYQGHLAMARIAEGEPVGDLMGLHDRLAKVPAGQGYGRFVLGHLAFHGERWPLAEQYLEAFVKRSTSGRVVLAIALEGEIALARRTLATLKHKRDLASV